MAFFPPPSMRRLCRLLPIIITVYCLMVSGAMGQGLPQRVAATLDPSDALLVTEEPQRVIFSQNADLLGVPASILKIPTALFALRTLGETYRFPMDVSVTKKGLLCLKGYGDPLLTSEVLDTYARTVAHDLKNRGIFALTGIGVDALYFDPVTIPGVNLASHQPYDAPNGALCANFNTVFYTRSPDGLPMSAESQTPLLPFLIRRIPSDASQGRIRLTSSESRLYAGHLFGWFLQKHGIALPSVITPHPYPEEGTLYERRLLSPYALPEVVKRLMAFSNNFMANQLFLAAGAFTQGPPASLKKSLRAFCNFMNKEIKRCPKVVEGSGISRFNTISARTMDTLLVRFASHANLLRHDKGLRFKTGTLEGVSTRAGYLTTPAGKKYRFVILTHREGGDAGLILDAVQSALADSSGGPKK